MSARARKEMAVECQYCGQAFKPRGIKRHENVCARSRCKLREFSVPGLDATTFAIVASFLNNQSVVKMQLVTGGRFPGSDAKVSAVCCRCENEELVIENGLCLECNLTEDTKFCQTITTMRARALIAVQDISRVPHKTHRVPHRGYYSLFKYGDLLRFALTKFPSKRAWLEKVAASRQRREKLHFTRQKNDEERETFLDALPEACAQFLKKASRSRVGVDALGKRAERYKLMVAALEKIGLPISRKREIYDYVVDGVGEPDAIAAKLLVEAQQIAERARLLDQLPADFVRYVGSYSIGHDMNAVQRLLDRYVTLKEALAARDLELRGDSVLCRQYIRNGQGALDDIVDTTEEMKFLFTYTSYSSDCRNILPQRDHYYDSDGWDSPDEYWISEAELRVRRENIKNRIRDRFVRNPRGMTLPLKWQRLVNQNQGSVAATTA